MRILKEVLMQSKQNAVSEGLVQKSCITSYRAINAVLVLLSSMAMLYALLFLQKYLGLHPCPLCIFQRIGVLIMLLCSFLAFILNPQKFWLRAFFWLGGLLGVLWSIAVAVRHVWLQYVPSGATCGAGLSYWVETLPMSQVVALVFAGSGDCAKIDWTLFGLSIPAQALIVFLGFLALYCYQGVLIWRHNTRQS